MFTFTIKHVGPKLSFINTSIKKVEHPMSLAFPQNPISFIFIPITKRLNFNISNFFLILNASNLGLLLVITNILQYYQSYKICIGLRRTKQRSDTVETLNLRFSYLLVISSFHAVPLLLTHMSGHPVHAFCFCTRNPHKFHFQALLKFQCHGVDFYKILLDTEYHQHNSSLRVHAFHL